jgi:hypothetical protein
MVHKDRCTFKKIYLQVLSSQFSLYYYSTDMNIEYKITNSMEVLFTCFIFLILSVLL